MKTWLIIIGVCVVVLAASDIAVAAKISAYYTKVDSGREFEKYSRTGPYADIVVVLETGRLVFWRGSSYLPYWETQKGKTFVDEVIARSGDGPAERPDMVNTYSRVAIIDDGPDEVVVYWRYLPQFGGKNPRARQRSTIGGTPPIRLYRCFASHPTVLWTRRLSVRVCPTKPRP